MQEKLTRRSNKARTHATRAALIAAARECFVEKGYAETGTPEIVAKAGVTRGALYHHFDDKADVLRAVVVREAQAVAAQIERETAKGASATDTLMAGVDAYFAAMAAAGRAHLLLVEGPSILGHAEMHRIDRETGGETLRQGFSFAMPKGVLKSVPLDALAELLSAAFDRAALAIAEGEPVDGYRAAVRMILTGLLETA